jgi:hypothetical protein
VILFAFLIAAFFLLNVLQRFCVLLVNSVLVSAMGCGRSVFFWIEKADFGVIFFFFFSFFLYFFVLLLALF